VKSGDISTCSTFGVSPFGGDGTEVISVDRVE
jgi:hypothetical protein